MKEVVRIGLELRRALNEQRGYVSADDLSAAIWQASMAVFGHKLGHPVFYRPGQALAPEQYQINDRIDLALHEFQRVQDYGNGGRGRDLPISADGVIAFPVAANNAGEQTLENSFQFATALIIPGAKRVTAINDNALTARFANSITAPTTAYPIRIAIQEGYRILPVGYEYIGLKYLAAPPRPVFAEMPDANDPLEMVYDDVNSVDIGWKEITAINTITAVATILLGGQVKDQLAISLANQTLQRGA